MAKGELLGRERLRRDFPDVERSAQEVGRLIGGSIPPGFGFALLMFSFGEGGYMTHVSNCVREDLVKALRETADALERRADSPPGIVGQAD